MASGFLNKSRIPMIFPTEEKAFNTCLSVLGNLPGIKPRIIIIKNTLKLDKMLVLNLFGKKLKIEKIFLLLIILKKNNLIIK